MTQEIENNQVEHDLSHVPTKEQLQGIEPLEVKKRAITAGLVVELEPDEADALGIAAYDQLGEGDEQLEQDLLESRFDPANILIIMKLSQILCWSKVSKYHFSFLRTKGASHDENRQQLSDVY